MTNDELLNDLSQMLPTILRDLDIAGFIAAAGLVKEWIATLKELGYPQESDPLGDVPLYEKIDAIASANMFLKFGVWPSDEEATS